MSQPSYIGVSDPNQMLNIGDMSQNPMGIFKNMQRKNLGFNGFQDIGSNMNFGYSNSGFDIGKYSMPDLGSYSDAWSKGGFGGLWDRLSSPKGGTIFNPGKSDLEMGIGGLSALAGLYGAYKQNEYSNKMRQLAERQQSMYEQQIADQNRRRDLAQSNYNKAMGV